MAVRLFPLLPTTAAVAESIAIIEHPRPTIPAHRLSRGGWPPRLFLTASSTNVMHRDRAGVQRIRPGNRATLIAIGCRAPSGTASTARGHLARPWRSASLHPGPTARRAVLF